MSGPYITERRHFPLTTRVFFLTCALVLGAASAVAPLLGWSTDGAVGILGIGTAGGVLLARLQPRTWRSEFLALFLLGLTVRVVAHLAVFALARSANGPFLSPDATLYFGQSLRLALMDLQVPVPAYVFFGSFDCAHYYLFGAARLLLGADLFGLQMVNIVLSSLAGPLIFAIARRLAVPYAFLIGCVTALYPSLIAVSINDLMRDASVIGMFLVGAWAVIEIWAGAGTRTRRMLLVGVAVPALTYVRMSRFYVPAFFEAAIIVALGLAVLKRMAGATVSLPGRAAVVSLLGVLLLVEGLPMTLGWPSSPMMVWQQINHSLETPAMRMSGVGMVDRIQAGGQIGPRHGSDLSASGNISRRASDIVAELTRGPRAGGAPPAIAQPAPPPVVAKAEGPPPTTRQQLVRIASNGVRKLFGPFPWVMPPVWDVRTILVGDYLMFPGMLVWYLLLPLALAGLGMIAWHAWRDARISSPLLALAAFVTLLFGQFMVLNLSYRQREFMFPFLAVSAAYAVHRGYASRWAALSYAGYLAGIVLLAAVHLAMRARVVS